MKRPSYHAFISYRHLDNQENGRKWADWIHQRIESYEIPENLKGKTTKNYRSLPVRLFPIYMDLVESNPGNQLSTEIEEKLSDSSALIVICSPNAAKKESWVEHEVEYFKRNHPARPIIPVIIHGEPFAAESQKDPSLECFPTSLRYSYDANGKITQERSNIIAVDLRLNIHGQKVEGWTVPGIMITQLNTTFGISSLEARQITKSYELQLEEGLIRMIASLCGLPITEFIGRESILRQKSEDTTFLDNLQTNYRKNKKSIPDPFTGEKWEVFTEIFAGNIQVSGLSRAFRISKHSKVNESKIKNVFWCNDQLFALVDSIPQTAYPFKGGKRQFSRPYFNSARGPIYLDVPKKYKDRGCN